MRRGGLIAPAHPRSCYEGFTDWFLNRKNVFSVMDFVLFADTNTANPNAVNMVRVVGVEPTCLAAGVFETPASTIPPHPQLDSPHGRRRTLARRGATAFL